MILSLILLFLLIRIFYLHRDLILLININFFLEFKKKDSADFKNQTTIFSNTAAIKKVHK